MWPKLRDNKLFSYLSLFSSFGTLLCCAIPSTLVFLGLGASLANFVGEFPQLLWISEHKGWVFALSFCMLSLSYFGQRYSQNLSCPIEKKEDCEKTRSWGKPIFFLTLSLNVIGFIYAFVLPVLL